MTHPTMEAARAYLTRGWRLIPIRWTDPRGRCSCERPDCGSPGKHPLTVHGLKDATDNPDLVAEWLARWPLMNLAVVTGEDSGIVVVDVDGDEGVASMAEFDARMPRTLMAKSPHGWHLYFAHDGTHTPNRGRFLPGVDIRGDGGYVLLAPSRLGDGDDYRWLREMPLSDFPRWLLAEADGRAARRTSAVRFDDGAVTAARADAPPWIREALRDGATAGARNGTATRLAGYFLSRGLPVDVVATVLESFRRACSPPMDAAELSRTIASCARYAVRARTAGVIDPPAFTALPTGGRYVWERAGVAVTVDGVILERGAIMAEIRIDCILPGLPERLHGPVRMNLLNTGERGRLAAYLAGRLPMAWNDVLEVVFRLAIEAHREGEPPMLLRDAVKPSGGGYAVEPLALASDPTLWFADGGIGKSLFALALSCAMDGWPDVLGLPVARPRKVLYLDWEWEAWRHMERLDLLLGEEAGACNILYRRMHGPLVGQIDQLAAIVREHGVEYVVIDSVGMACGGEPESAAIATAFANAVRSLGVGSLWLSHVAKAATDDGQKAFGSGYWHNMARMTWWLQCQSEPGASTLKVAFHNRKANATGLVPSMSFRVDFGGERARIVQTDINTEDVFQKALPSTTRVLSALGGGAATVAEIARASDMTPHAVGRALLKLQGAGRAVELGGGRWGLPEPPRLYRSTQAVEPAVTEEVLPW